MSACPPLPRSIGSPLGRRFTRPRTRGRRATRSGSRRPTPWTRVWRNRDEFITGGEAIVEFLTRKWERELDYALRKSLWAFTDDRIAVRFQYESHDREGNWWRSYGNALWEFDGDGLTPGREASINDVPIGEAERRYFGPRPESERGTDIPLH